MTEGVGGPSAVPSPAAFAASSPLIGRGGIRRLRAANGDEIPAYAGMTWLRGIHGDGDYAPSWRWGAEWIPAYAGMTIKEARRDDNGVRNGQQAQATRPRDGAQRAPSPHISSRLVIPAKAKPLSTPAREGGNLPLRAPSRPSTRKRPLPHRAPYFTPCPRPLPAPQLVDAHASALIRLTTRASP